jgi:hypothetical protein
MRTVFAFRLKKEIIFSLYSGDAWPRKLSDTQLLLCSCAVTSNMGLLLYQSKVGNDDLPISKRIKF